MPLVHLDLDIEEIAFIPVLRVLKGLPGVANVHFDLDMLGKKRGGQRKPGNGHDATPLAEPKTGRAGLKPIIIAALLERPQTSADLSETVAAAGYKKHSTWQTLNTLKKDRIVFLDKLGIWALTPNAKAKLQATEGEATERRALPPPDKPPEAPPMVASRTPRKRGDGVSGPAIIVAALQREGKSMSRLELQKRMVEKGFAPVSIDGAIGKSKEFGWIENDGLGILKLTKEGRKYKPAPEAFPSTAQ